MELPLNAVLTETENQHKSLPADVSLVSLTTSGGDQKQKAETDFLRLSFCFTQSLQCQRGRFICVSPVSQPEAPSSHPTFQQYLQKVTPFSMRFPRAVSSLYISLYFPFPQGYKGSPRHSKTDRQNRQNQPQNSHTPLTWQGIYLHPLFIFIIHLFVHLSTHCERSACF